MDGWMEVKLAFPKDVVLERAPLLPN